jgi:cytochrome d ubiquinol oxidase subunit II
VGVAAAALVAAHVAVEMRRFGWAFVASAVAIVAAVVLIFGSLYPDVMPSTTDAVHTSLTVTNASATHYPLTVMTWVAGILTPVVLAYQAWTYWVFRRRLSVESIPAHSEPTFAKV